MRLLIAMEGRYPLYSRPSSHFGRCPYFAIHDTETSRTEVVKNTIDHNDQTQTPVDQVMMLTPDAVFTLGMGRKALGLFEQRNIKVLTGNYSTVQQVVQNTNNLKELDEGCAH